MKTDVINEQGFVVSVVGASGLLGRALLDDLLSWIPVRMLYLFDSPRNSGEELTVEDGQSNSISLSVSVLPPISEAAASGCDPLLRERHYVCQAFTKENRALRSRDLGPGFFSKCESI